MIFRHNPWMWIWAAFALLWFGAAFFSKQTVKRQTSGSRWLQILPVAVAYFLFFEPNLGIRWLHLRVLPATTTFIALGYGILLAGIVFATWARLLLGGNWSSDVTVKQDHTLVRSGPYRIVRHPIYTGLLFALLGTATVVGELRCFVGVALAAIGWKIKSCTEEDFMLQQFGETYARYRMEVKALVPYVW